MLVIWQACVCVCVCAVLNACTWAGVLAIWQAGSGSACVGAASFRIVGR